MPIGCHTWESEHTEREPIGSLWNQANINISETMTKTEAVAHCRQVFRERPEHFKGDAAARREFFGVYIDSLCKDGEITLRQYQTWTNPF